MGGRRAGAERREALSRADLQILWHGRAGAGSGYGASHGLGRGLVRSGGGGTDPQSSSGRPFRTALGVGAAEAGAPLLVAAVLKLPLRPPFPSSPGAHRSGPCRRPRLAAPSPRPGQGRKATAPLDSARGTGGAAGGLDSDFCGPRWLCAVGERSSQTSGRGGGGGPRGAPR